MSIAIIGKKLVEVNIYTRFINREAGFLEFPNKHDQTNFDSSTHCKMRAYLLI